MRIEDLDCVIPYMILACFALLLGLAVTLTVFVPAQLAAERECMAAGYPRARVTYALERYCITLDGVVTVRVDRK